MMDIMKKDTRALSEEAQAMIREKAVEAVRSGMTHAEAARAFGGARGTVSEWRGGAGLREERRGVRLSVWTPGLSLRRWGLTPQKPLRRAFEQNPDAVRRWL